jgi:Mrp family chromosome partitioning ATPase
MLRTASTRETLGTLAAGLRFGPGGGAAKTLLVVSPLGGDGKSSLAAALAGSFRRMGERVLVVSADLRGPAAALPAGIEPLRALGPRAPGGIDRFIGRDEETGADVVHGGGWVDNPWALFNSVEFALFFEAVKARYDRIVVDTPPLAVFGDALALTPFADLALFVFGFNKVPVRTARRTLRSIAETGLPVAGVVVNGVRPFDLRVHFPGHHKRRGSYRAYGGRSAGAPRPEVAEAGP